MPLKEVLADVARWQEAGERAAIARVVGVVGSSPREAGAAMAVSEGSEVAGSVSGGCGSVVVDSQRSLSPSMRKESGSATGARLFLIGCRRRTEGSRSSATRWNAMRAEAR